MSLQGKVDYEYVCICAGEKPASGRKASGSPGQGAHDPLTPIPTSCALT